MKDKTQDKDFDNFIAGIREKFGEGGLGILANVYNLSEEYKFQKEQAGAIGTMALDNLTGHFEYTLGQAFLPRITFEFDDLGEITREITLPTSLYSARLGRRHLMLASWN